VRKVFVILPIVVLLFIAQGAAASGYLDTSFGQRGTIALPDLHPPSPCCPLSALTVLAFGKNGRIWADATEGSFSYLYAFTATGKPDLTFHSGKPLNPFSADGTEAIALLPRSDGGVLVVDRWCCGSVGEAGISVAAVNSNGSYDSSYGDQNAYLPGRAEHTYTNYDYNTGEGYSAALMLQSGAVRVCGFRQTQTFPSPPVVQMLLVGFTPTGQPDTAVGPQGWRVVSGLSSCKALVLDGSGKLFAAGTERDSTGKTSVVVARLSSEGDTDSSYGVNGVATLSRATRSVALVERSAAIDPNGGLLVGLATKDPGQRWMAATGRFTAAGLVDTAFGYGGIYRYVPSAGSSALTSLDVTKSGRMLLSLRYATPSGTQLMLVRALDATGRFDPSFGYGGTVRVTVNGVQAITDALGRIVSGGPTPYRYPAGTESYLQRRTA